MFYFQIYSFPMKCWKPSNYMRELDYSVSVTVGLLTLEKIIMVVGGGQQVGAQEKGEVGNHQPHCGGGREDQEQGLGRNENPQSLEARQP